jgi:hypothetical protein
VFSAPAILCTTLLSLINLFLRSFRLICFFAIENSQNIDSFYKRKTNDIERDEVIISSSDLNKVVRIHELEKKSLVLQRLIELTRRA